MKISIIGAGYVGLSTGACLAELGHETVCTDNDLHKLEMLRGGGLPFYEPHLADVVHRNRASGRLRFADIDEAIQHSEAIFICVGTPPLANGDADLSAIASVARNISELARGYRLVIDKSTVPVQTGRQLQRQLALYSKNDLRCDVVSNPEFLREGSAVEDFFHPDRIIIGTDSQLAVDRLQEIYRSIIDQTFTCPVHSHCTNRKRVPVVVSDINSAELVKHASNSFLAMKISFANLVADLCEAAGGDIEKVTEGMGLDPRIGPSFLRPGIGFGGFCFPKDLQAFVRIAEKLGSDFSLLKEVERINTRRVESFIEKVRNEIWVLRGRTLAVWGLAFKPNTDDTRFAPSLAIIRRLIAEGAHVRAYDPKAIARAKAELPEIHYCSDIYECAESADAVLILTEWDEFRAIDWATLRKTMHRPLIIDGRNMFAPAEVVSQGFDYITIGRAQAAGIASAKAA